MLAIDHVILPVRDLTLAAAEIERRSGLASVEGGRHPAWGTANRIVPLGDAYLELISVVDPGTASRSAFGQWVARAIPDRPLGWAVRTDSIEAIGRRLDLPVVPGSRAEPGRALITWRSAGLDIAIGEPGLPFFIQWGDGVSVPGARKIDHPGGPTSLKRLSVPANPHRLAAWLGDHDLPIAMRGSAGTFTITLTRGRDDFTLA